MWMRICLKHMGSHPMQHNPKPNWNCLLHWFSRIAMPKSQTRNVWLNCGIWFWSSCKRFFVDAMTIRRLDLPSSLLFFSLGFSSFLQSVFCRGGHDIYTLPGDHSPIYMYLRFILRMCGLAALFFFRAGIVKSNILFTIISESFSFHLRKDLAKLKSKS